MQALATATCSLLQKCLPLSPLPLISAQNSIKFSLDAFQTYDAHQSSSTENTPEGKEVDSAIGVEERPQQGHGERFLRRERV